MKSQDKKSERKVSLSFEIDELAHLLDGARILADGLGNRGLSNEHDEQVAALAIRSNISMAISRMQQLGRVARGEADPRTILSAQNETVDGAAEQDVTFTVWRDGAKGPK